MKKKKRTTTKCVVWCCLINGIAWVWCSYILAFLGKTDIAEGLSKVAVTEIVGVVLVYCAKSLFEKREGFGAVGKENDTDYPDKGGQEGNPSVKANGFATSPSRGGEIAQSDARNKYTRDL